MRKRTGRIVPVVTILLSVFSSVVYSGTYSGGTGDPNTPYLIANAEDLQAIGTEPNDWDKNFLVTANIDLSAYTGTSFNIIAPDVSGYYDHDTYYFGGTPFTGVFDGNDFVISNFTWTDEDYSYFIGIFGCIGQSGIVKNVHLTNVNIDTEAGQCKGTLAGASYGTVMNCSAQGSLTANTYTYVCCSAASDYVGGLIGRNTGDIDNCHTDVALIGTFGCANTCKYGLGSYIGGITGGNNISDYGSCHYNITNCTSQGIINTAGGLFIGGLVGCGNNIDNCYATGRVYSSRHTDAQDSSTGGLAGIARTISNSYATGNVSGPTWDGLFIGGLVGYCVTINNCYALGDVIGNSDVGGLAGLCDDSITNSYAMGSVTGEDTVGGLVGSSWEIINCYAAGSVTGDSTVGGLVAQNHGTVSNSFWDIETSGQTSSSGGTGKTTLQMMDPNTFTSAGWDFVTIWDICEGMNYPKLSWQEPVVGDIVCPDGVELVDFAYLASRWLDDECAGSNDCDGADLDLSGAVDIGDAVILAEHWLEGTKPGYN